MTDAFRILLCALLTITVSAIAPLSASAQTHHQAHHHSSQVHTSRRAKELEAERQVVRHHHNVRKAKTAKRTGHDHHKPVEHASIHRHAQLCQQVMVHQHWVSHCR
ncbi:MAG TPA: hypothetical protein VGF33_06550 [Caulobacteraceae bacterium]|jgi:hypothetical protein